MKKKFLLFLSFLSLAMTAISLPVAATKPTNQVSVYMFVGATCPHCKHLEEDIVDYAKDKEYARLRFYEVYNNQKNQRLIKKVSDKLGVKGSGVPLIIIGDWVQLGYSGSDKQKLVDRIEYCKLNDCPDSLKDLVKTGQEWPEMLAKIEQSKKSQSQEEQSKESTKSDDIIDLPLGIKLNKRTVSLPVMTIVIGLLDGFNPCAMWALVFVITLLIGLNDKKKMWAYGLAFIATSAAVYTLFMLAWLSVFNIIGFVRPIQIIVGLVAIGIGGYYLNQYRKKDNLCKVSADKKRLTYFEKMKQSVESSSFWLGLVGVVVLAVAVNMVELVCSAGLPAVYTSVLSAANLSSLQYAFYIGLYILFFMLDDIIVFAIAVKTMSVVNIDGKYSKFSRLVGGSLMLIIGLLLIFAPQLLMFG